MRARGDGHTCRGATRNPSGCSAPGGCTTADWIVCRNEQPERAMDAVRVLARELAYGRNASGSCPFLPESLVERALATLPDRIPAQPPDRPLSTWVSELLWEENRDRRARGRPADRDDTPTPPEGWDTWKRVHDALLVEAKAWIRGHDLLPTDAEEFAEAALERLLEQRHRGREVRYVRAWARRVFVNFICDAARGRAEGPLAPRKELPAFRAWELGTEKEASSPERQVEQRDLADRYLRKLPQPYRQIAQWMSLGLPPRDLAALLRTWRPIGDSAARKLLLRTYEMLRALGDGRDLRETWPRRFQENTPWNRVKPGPLLRP